MDIEVKINKVALQNLGIRSILRVGPLSLQRAILYNYLSFGGMLMLMLMYSLSPQVVSISEFVFFQGKVNRVCRLCEKVLIFDSLLWEVLV